MHRHIAHSAALHIAHSAALLTAGGISVLAGGCNGGELEGATGGVVFAPPSATPVLPQSTPSTAATTPPVVTSDPMGMEPPVGAPVAAPPDCDYSPTRVWRLTHAQLRNTVKDVFGVEAAAIDNLPDESRVDAGAQLRPYANASGALQVPSLLLDGYFGLSEEIAEGVSIRATEFTQCPVTMPSQAACLASEFIPTVGLRAWRRPLTEGEVAKLAGLHSQVEADTGGPLLAFRSLVQAMVMSPNFFFRTELGAAENDPTQAVALTEYELASALSYTLWDSPPDAELLELASQGLLSANLAPQAERLWSDRERASAVLNRFIAQWLGIERLQGASEDFKDAEAFEGYSSVVGEAYLAEARAFVDEVVFGQQDASLRTLLTATFAYASDDTVGTYGLEGPVSPGMNRVDLNPAERRGILTQAAFLTSSSASHDTAPVARGVFLRETLMCEKLVLPPIPIPPLEEVEFGDETQTEREKLEVHREPVACRGCHSLFDPLGLAMENYDPIGRYRTVDVGKPIDPSGEVPVRNATLAFSNFVDLVDQLAEQPAVYDCFARQYLMYSSGAQEAELRQCDVQQVGADFAASSYNLDSLVLAAITRPGFVVRSKGE